MPRARTWLEDDMMASKPRKPPVVPATDARDTVLLALFRQQSFDPLVLRQGQAEALARGPFDFAAAISDPESADAVIALRLVLQPAPHLPQRSPSRPGDPTESDLVAAKSTQTIRKPMTT
jgi:hypothetical protein